MSGWVAGAVVVGAAVGAYATSQAADAQASAAEQAAQTSAGAQVYSANLQKQMFDKQIELQKPWYDVGTRALPKLEAQAGAMPAAFTGQVNLGQDPGYAFRLAEGQKALERSAAARGGLISGGALKAAQRYGQDYASQEYGNAYRRALDVYNAAVQRESTGYNRLASLAGVGQTTAQQLGQAGQQYGTNASNLAMTNAANQGNALLAAGQARSSAYQGYGSAAGQALGGIGNYLNQYNTGGGYTGWGTTGRTGAVDASTDAGMANFYG